MNPPRTTLFARHRQCAGLLVATSVLVLAPATAKGQVPLLEPPALGTHVFQNFLHGLGGLQPLNGLDELAAKKPRECVLVVFGDLSCLERMRPGLKDFIAAGGAVLLASDQASSARLTDVQLRITGRSVIVPTKVQDLDNKKGTYVMLVPPGRDGIAPDGLVSLERKLWEPKPKPELQKHTYDEVKELLYGSTANVILTASRWRKQEAVAYVGLDQEFDDCIVVKGHIGVEHPIFADCTLGIVVDKPSYLIRLAAPGPPGEAWSLPILCNFPPFWSEPKGPQRSLVREPGFVAASDGKPKSKERVIILSGHSLFLNCAIGQRDLDNVTFTANTIRWLTDSKERKYCLFVRDNQAVTKFDVPLLVPPMPTSRMINDFLRALEEENFFNRAVVDNIAKYRILRVLMTLALIGLAIYGFRRYCLARHRQDYTVPLVETKLVRLVSDFLPPLARRRHEALRRGDFREAARVVARESFAGARGKLPAQPPRAAGVKDQERAALTDAVQRLWSMATGQDDVPVTADAFSRIVELSRRVQAALAGGTLRWQS
jgi:hypothetical protein